MSDHLKQSALDYFKSFSEKNIAKISEMFSEDINLQDWEILASGKADVLTANREIFDSVASIKVMPQRLFSEGATVVAELEITIDSKTKLSVVDVLDFNDNGLISNIRAYKG
jgi:hypothetical protein